MDDFLLHGILVNFKQKLNITHVKLINAMKINLSLSHVKSYDAIDKEIIKHTVNINGEGFSNYADDDAPQDIIKGINATLEYKSSVERERERLRSCGSFEIENSCNQKQCKIKR